MNFLTFLLTLASLACLGLAFTCDNDGNGDRDVRFNSTTFSFCYHIPTTQCGYGTYLPRLGHTCRLLSVKVTNHTLVTPDYIGSERCGCIDAVYGSLVILVDANPADVTNDEWELRVIDTLDWFYHGVTQERVPGSIFNITYLFLHGSSYFETTTGETYNVFVGSNLTTNPWSQYASTESVTYPCDAINHAIDILDTTTIDYRSRRRLFYWGFSTPDLKGCNTGGRTFNNIATYAMRQTTAVNLSAIESTYGDFSECDWYQDDSDSYPVDSEAIQNRAIVGTLSDFICEIEETPAPTSFPTLAPTTPAPTTAAPTLPPTTTASPTLAPTTTASPTLPPTTAAPTLPPTTTAAPTLHPIETSSLPVTETPPPTSKPTSKPTPYPSLKPTPKPTPKPTLKPTSKPSSWWSSTTKPTPKPTRSWWA